MKILAFDTVDFTAAVGIFLDGRISVVTFSPRQRPLLLETAKLLKSQKLKIEDVDGFVAYLGPGESFTGTRVGISVVNALSFALGKPSFGFCCLSERDQKSRLCLMLQKADFKNFSKKILKPVYAATS